MAKKNRSGSSATAERSAASASPSRSGRGAALVGVGALIVLAGGGIGYALWHKRNDPSHVWATQFQQAREAKLERHLQNCFGGTDGGSLRRLAGDLRRGVWPEPYKRCGGSVMTEVVSAPMDLEADLRNPPAAMENVRAKERGRLEHLRIALDVLQRASALPRTQPVPDAARDTILTSLEDAAVDVDAERQSFGELLDTADSAASIW